MARASSCPLPPTEFTPIERIFNAEPYGIEPFASQVHDAREALIADALAARVPNESFHRAVWQLRWRCEFDPRLAEKFMSFPPRVRERHAGMLLLLAYDDRARHELARIGPRIRTSLFKGFPLWIGRVGGPGIRELLEARVCELQREVKKSRRARPALLENYGATCAALVCLDPESSLGAEPLLEMFAARNERVVAMNTIGFLRDCVVAHRESLTTPLVRIRAALRELLDPRAPIDDLEFAVQAIVEFDRMRTLARIDAILDSEPKGTPFICLQTAAEFGSPPHRAVTRFITARVTTWNAAGIALKVADSLTIATRTKIAENALKQRDVYSRFAGARLLRATPGPRARTLARRFASTERDELVRLVLQQRAAARWQSALCSSS